MRHWYTADCHFGHGNIIKYCNRPFKNPDHMNRILIKNWNMRVKPGDIVYHVGDFCFRSPAGMDKATYWESKLNGKIIFLKGNHDNNNSCKTIINGMLLESHGYKYYLVHKPIHYNPRYCLNFTGHVHNNWSVKHEGDSIFDASEKEITLLSTLVNVGVDVNKFMPRTFEELVSKI